MRAPCIVVLVSFAAASAGCGLGLVGQSAAPPTDDPQSDTCGGAEGALPAPTCGEGACSCCGSCDPMTELCFTDDWSFSLGYGHCRSSPADGVLQATIDGQAFVATEVAAIASDTYLQVTGGIGTVDVDRRQLAFQVPSQLGTFDCAATPVIAIGYEAGATRAESAARQSPRPACTLTLTAIGAVGERIEGSLSAALVEEATGVTLDVTGATFSVERIPYP